MVPPSYSAYIRRMKDMAGGQFLLDTISVFAIDKLWDVTPEKFIVLNILSDPGIAEIAEVTTHNDAVNNEQKSKFAVTRLYTAPHSLQSVATDDYLDAFVGKVITHNAHTRKYVYRRAKHPPYIRDIIAPFERAVESLPAFADIPIVATVPASAFKCAKAIIYALQQKYHHLHGIDYLPSDTEYPSKKRAIYLRESPWAMQIHSGEGYIDPVTIIKGGTKTPLILTVPLNDATLGATFDGATTWRDILPAGLQPDAEMAGEKLANITIKATYDSLQNVLVTVQGVDGSTTAKQYFHYGIKPDEEIAETKEPDETPKSAEAVTAIEINKPEETVAEQTGEQRSAEPSQTFEAAAANVQEPAGEEIVVFGPDLFIKDANIIGHVRVGIKTLLTPMHYDTIDKQRKAKPGKAEKEYQQALTSALDGIAAWLDSDHIIYEAEHTAKKQYGRIFHPLRDIVVYLQSQGKTPVIYTDDAELMSVLNAEGFSVGTHDDFKHSKYYTRRPKSVGKAKRKVKQSLLKPEYLPNESPTLIMPDQNAYYQIPDIISHISEEYNAAMPPIIASELLYPAADNKRAAKLTKKAKEAAEKAQAWATTPRLRVIEQRAVEMRMGTEWSGKHMLDWSPKTGNTANNILRVAMALTSGYGSSDSTKYEVPGQNVVIVTDDPYTGAKVNLAHSYLTRQCGCQTNLVWMTTEEFKQSPYYTSAAKNPEDYTKKP